MRLTALIAAFGSLALVAAADTVHLTNGGVIHGTVIQEAEGGLTVAMQYGTVKLSRAEITSVDKSIVEESETKDSQPPHVDKESRLPRWSTVVTRLAKASWATGLTQIPATVIDKGVMRNVPYTSYQCGVGADYELNLYGDPDRPAGVEIGVYGALTKDAAAKRRCVDFIASVLTDATDAALVKAARVDKDRIERGGLTIEVTPPTADDAYGGWWVSVYYVQRLDLARASRQELERISVSSKQPESPPAAKPARTPKSPAARAVGKEPDTRWTRQDLQKARKTRSSGVSSSSGGRVYVRGYYRKDGTYVRGHTRSRRR